MWRLKLFLKILAGQLPWLRTVFQAMGYYRLGPMDCPEYALRTFQRHMGPLSEFVQEGGTCLEIGPGLALSTAVISRAAGFERTILLDCDRFALKSTRVYQELHQHFLGTGLSLPDIAAGDTLEQILQRYNACYWTHGDAALRSLADQSIRFSFSQAVLSQIPRTRVSGFLRELKRVSQPGTRSSHWIDLTDYFGGGFHQLRFSDEFWESPWLYKSGVYTNRLRFSQWLEQFGQAGINYRVSEQRRAECFSLPRRVLDRQFQEMSDEDLLTQSFRVEFFWTEDTQELFPA